MAYQAYGEFAAWQANSLQISLITCDDLPFAQVLGSSVGAEDAHLWLRQLLRALARRKATQGRGVRGEGLWFGAGLGLFLTTNMGSSSKSSSRAHAGLPSL